MFHVKHPTRKEWIMTGTTARKLTYYLRKQKCGLIKVHTIYDKELGTWTVVIVNNYNQEIYQWHKINRDSVRLMSTLVKSVANW